MSELYNRVCVICNRGYHVCKNCEDAAKLGQKRWRNSCDKPECYQALLILTEFYYNRIDKHQAREMLSGVLSEEMLPYDPNAKILIDKIFEEDVVSTPVLEERQEEISDNQEIVSDDHIENTCDIIVNMDTTVEYAANDKPEAVVNDINDCYEADGD